MVFEGNYSCIYGSLVIIINSLISTLNHRHIMYVSIHFISFQDKLVSFPYRCIYITPRIGFLERQLDTVPAHSGFISIKHYTVYYNRPLSLPVICSHICFKQIFVFSIAISLQRSQIENYSLCWDKNFVLKSLQRVYFPIFTRNTILFKVIIYGSFYIIYIYIYV